jgi:prepilin-type N-terminal cleavage/methylation domain-containing protein
MKILSHHRRGFTLIEVIVVISTLAFTLPIVTIILFIIIRQQIAVTRMTESKRQGDQATALIQNVLTQEVNSMYGSGGAVCANDTGAIQDILFFMDENGDDIQFGVSNGVLNITRVASGVASTEPLTNSQRVIVENSPTYPFTVQCIRNKTYTDPIVGISFSVIPFGNFRTEELATMRLHYSTKVIIRDK